VYLLLTSSRTLNLYQILNKAEVEKFETTIDSRERAKTKVKKMMKTKSRISLKIIKIIFNSDQN
jgi:hypothetical protein